MTQETQETQEKPLKEPKKDNIRNWIKSFFDDQIGFKEILLTALLTSIFTTLSSFFIVKSEKATEQSYWKKRTEFETLKEPRRNKLKHLMNLIQNYWELKHLLAI